MWVFLLYFFPVFVSDAVHTRTHCIERVVVYGPSIARMGQFLLRYDTLPFQMLLLPSNFAGNVIPRGSW